MNSHRCGIDARQGTFGVLVIRWLFIVSTLLCQLAAAPANAASACELPLYANWNAGIASQGYGPAQQKAWLAAGHKIAPWFSLAPPGESLNLAYFSTAIVDFRTRKLPITFVSTQWERLLSEGSYLAIKDDTSPNVLPLIGKPQEKLSPFGDAKYWYDVGYQWTSRDVVKKLQTLYPDPPRVIFLSNNEHPKLNWTELTQDKRFLKRYPGVIDPEKQRELAAGLWKTLYQSLQQGMRDGLVSDTWKKNTIFIGFMANGNTSFGRSGWQLERLFTLNDIDPYAGFWNGSSYAFYYNSAATMYKDAPLGLQNAAYMIAQDRKRNANYFRELSLWDGHTYDRKDWRKLQEQKAVGASLSSYIALSKLAMWLIKPAIVREFRFYDETLSANQRYTEEIIAQIDQIHKSPVFQKFWCESTQVIEDQRKHPYDFDLTPEVVNAARWFLLSTSADSSDDWSSGSRKIFAIAMQAGASPNRQWLLYAFSTSALKTPVEVNIPGYRKVTISPSLEGDYYLVDEKDASVEPLSEPATPQILDVNSARKP